VPPRLQVRRPRTIRLSAVGTAWWPAARRSVADAATDTRRVAARNHWMFSWPPATYSNCCPSWCCSAIAFKRMARALQLLKGP